MLSQPGPEAVAVSAALGTFIACSLTWFGGGGGTWFKVVNVTDMYAMICSEP